MKEVFVTKGNKKCRQITGGLAQAGGMPADSFVRIWKFSVRPNLCAPPACVKPHGRYLQAGENTTRKFFI
jgi:hypothetical protein